MQDVGLEEEAAAEAEVYGPVEAEAPSGTPLEGRAKAHQSLAGADGADRSDPCLGGIGAFLGGGFDMGQ